MFAILRQRLWLIAGLAFLGLCLGVASSLFLVKTYTATATIEINKQTSPSVVGNTSSSASQDFASNDEMTTSMLTLQQELQGAEVGLRVVELEHLASAPPYDAIARPTSSAADAHRQQEQMLAIFQSHLKVDVVKDTRLLTVSFTDSDPERAAQVANAVIDTYIRSYAEERVSASEKTSESLSAQLTELREEVLDSERRVNEYKDRTGIVGTSDTAPGESPANLNADSVVVERFLQLNRDLTAAKVALVSRDALERVMTSQGPDAALHALRTGQVSGSSADSAFAGQEYIMLSSLRQQRSQLSVQVAARGQYLGPASPQMMQLQSELGALDRQIDEELSVVRAHVTGELRLALATEAGLRDLVQAQQKAVTTLNLGINQLRLLEQEANSKRTLYQDLYVQLQESKVSKGMNAATITVVDPARSPIAKSGPRTTRNGISGLVIGALLGVLIAFIQSPGRLFVLFLMAAGFPLALRAQVSPDVSANVDMVQQTIRTPPQVSSTLPGVRQSISNATLHPGFLIRMEIFGVPEMSTDLRVDADGNLNVPVLGKVHVLGLSALKAAELLQYRYAAARVLVRPNITVSLLQFATIGVSVLGEVQTPGLFEVDPSMTVEQVLALAGGETSVAGGSIEIRRRGLATPIVIPLTRGVQTAALQGMDVEEGDTVYVHKTGTVYVLGSVTRPGGYLMLDRGTMNILEAVALAEGTTLVASVDTFYVIRPGAHGTFQTIPVPYRKAERGGQSPFALLPRDILYVPSSKVKTVLVNGAALLGAAATSTIYAVRGP